MNLTDLGKNFSTVDEAREFLEKQRWPSGAVCPHCGLEGQSYRLQATKESKTPVRKGVWKCGGCRKQFTVTVGTIFEDSHIPLNKWLMAIHLLCSSKKGMSAHQLHRMLGITYKSAWFMAHRIRHAMTQEPLATMLSGTVEVDETYVSGKPREYGKRGRPGKDSKKVPVVASVERGGNVRSFRVPTVSGKNLKQVIRDHVVPKAAIMTDDFWAYEGLNKEFASHDSIRHRSGFYGRREGRKNVHTNTVEGFFSIVKRGIHGVYHHVGRQHLQRYLTEYDFRYNSRQITDGERTIMAIKRVGGKRLKYREAQNKMV